MTLSDIFLDGGAYAMDARGGIDFSTEEIKILVYTRILESVSRAVKWIPLVGGIVRAGTNQVGVAVRISGSPYDLKTEIVPGGSVVGTTVGVAGQAVRKVKDTLKKLIPGDRRNKPPEEVEPEPPQEIEPEPPQEVEPVPPQ